MCNRIRYFIRVKSGITDIISYNFGKIKVDSYASLPLEKAITFHNFIILIRSVWSKDKYKYYYNIFLENARYELPKKYFFCIKYKSYIMLELAFQKELLLTQQMHRNSVIFVIIDISLKKSFKSKSYICNRCHNLSMMSMNLSNFYVLTIKNEG